jgi:acyltransferase
VSFSHGGTPPVASYNLAVQCVHSFEESQIVFFTYQLNNGLFNFPFYKYVVILFSSHGNMLLFPLTAIAGCALILLIAAMTSTKKTIVWLGQNTLILMCLNGIFYHYINPPTAKWIMANLPNSSLSIFIVSFVMTFSSLAMCIPFVYALNRFVPQLVGKPKIKGPFLKNFI